MRSAGSSTTVTGGRAVQAPRPRLPRWLRVLDTGLTYRLLTLAIAAAAWQLLAVNAGGLLIPSFTETMLGVGRLLADSALWQAFLISNQAMVIGFVISIVVGIPVGLAMGRFRAAERLTDVYINILLVTPMATVIPLLVMAVGIGLASRIILVVFFTIIMVVVNSRAGVRQVDSSLIEMARSFGASERQLWWRVILPGAMPAVMAGVRIGLSRAVQGMVIVELLMVSVGIGGLILEYRGTFQVELLYATVVLVVLEALLLIAAARWVERRLIPWASAGGPLSNELGGRR